VLLLHKPPIVCVYFWSAQEDQFLKSGFYGRVTHVGEKCVQPFCSLARSRDSLEDLDLGGKATLRCMLRKENRRPWTGFVWLGIQTRDEVPSVSLGLVNHSPGAFTKLRKATFSFEISVGSSVCLSLVSLSVRMEQVCSHWTDFHEIWHLSILQNHPKNFKFY
jgi:hypothetical protein